LTFRNELKFHILLTVKTVITVAQSYLY